MEPGFIFGNPVPYSERCWADSESALGYCGFPAVSDFGLCLVHYTEKVRRLPDGFTLRDLTDEIESREREAKERTGVRRKA